MPLFLRVCTFILYVELSVETDFLGVAFVVLVAGGEILFCMCWGECQDSFEDGGGADLLPLRLSFVRTERGRW